MTTSERIADKLKHLPTSPGVYLMKNANGDVIYVGKAVVLRNRVRSYFHSQKGLSRKTRRLVQEIADIEVIQTATESEAFILEESLIKRLQPHFNIRLRDDKRYPYLKITNEPFPRLMIVRQRKDDGARYFGPYTSSKAMRSTMKLTQKLFPIRTCTLKLPLSKPRRPCLDYHIGRCLAPCANLVSEEEYKVDVDQAVMLLEGRLTGLLKQMREQMDLAAKDENFEQAARLRDQLVAVTHALERQSVSLSRVIDIDAIGLTVQGQRACAEVFRIRDGRLSGRETFHLRAPDGSTMSEVLSAFLPQYYTAATVIPQEVLIPVDIDDATEIADWLTSLRGRRVHIKLPQRGEKRHLVEMANENARYSLNREQKSATVRSESSEALSELASALSLASFPQRIEAYDISNTQGKESTGSMVVFEDGRPRRDAYRRFKIHLDEGPNDYAMMAEVLRRRFRRGLAELNDPAITEGKFSRLPDLLLIDGGKGQLHVAVDVLKELQLDEIEAIGLAKQHEEVFRPGESEPHILPQDSKALLLLRQIRDEAHRFAITYHRKLRGRRNLSSILDTIPGVGKKRKAALIAHFGSLQKLSQATVEQISSLPEIPASVAKQIADRLRSNR
ncbi:MAG TPA: excinuclease ABC subunit UvrC [Candidatus Acetothermia bacterium]|nr:excinuclease ABC subunit UvrC [Candidatus Acetothermia bacterium]